MNTAESAGTVLARKKKKKKVSVTNQIAASGRVLPGFFYIKKNPLGQPGVFDDIINYSAVSTAGTA